VIPERNKQAESEEELLKGIKVNDPKVLEQFYARQFPAVRSFVTKNSGNSDDAQDIFQEAMVASWLNVKEGRFKPSVNGSVGAYVYRIAKNKWLDKLRSAEYRNVNHAMSEVSDRIAEVSEEEKTNERIEYLRSIYSQLDDKCRTVLDMFYYEKKNLESIANELDYDIGSIRTIKYRCMMKLRKSHMELSKKKTL
jgi:RNA polymerase sigma factor (sigma-70 family)